jgi:hypothetical protein
MTSAICTLFEGNYHYGLGALVNSLYAQGFCGTLYVGYRGALPPWAVDLKTTDGFSEFTAAEGLVLRFIPLTTKIHLTNYKPDFMLDLWQRHCPKADAFFYFDPDIVIMCKWSFFEEWVEAGVTLCADINFAMPGNHPVRNAWKRFYEPHGFKFRREPDLYFNGGFFGLKKERMEFLTCWQRLQDLMAPAINGMHNVNIGDRTFLFHKTDQDALNVAAMTAESPISTMGLDGMDLQPGGGGYVMSHALGAEKPWKKKFVRRLLLRGNSPSRADRIYFKSVTRPIQLYSPAELSAKRLFLLTASFLARFMGRE